MRILKNNLNQEEIVRHRIYNEWKTFIVEILDYDKQIIVDMCDRIHFYDCVVIFFLSNEKIAKDDIRFLYQKEHIIYQMWRTYLGHEGIGFLTWPELEKLLRCWRKDEKG